MPTVGTAVVCGDPGTVSGGSVQCPPGHDYPDTCVLQCHPGFQLTGPASVHCQQDGQWSGQFSSCLGKLLPFFSCSCFVVVGSGPVWFFLLSCLGLFVSCFHPVHVCMRMHLSVCLCLSVSVFLSLSVVCPWNLLSSCIRKLSDFFFFFFFWKFKA